MLHSIPSPKNTRGAAGLLLALSLLAAGAGQSGCRRKEAAHVAATAAPVYVDLVRSENIPVFTDSFGTLTAYNAVTLVPQVGGILVAADFAEGVHVKKGQVLYRIDQAGYQQIFEKARAAVETQKVQLKTAQDRLRRSGGLTERQLIAPQDFEGLQASVDQISAALAAAEADLAQAKLDLERTVIAAPLDGIVGINPQDTGNLVVAMQTKLASIKQIDPLHVDFSIPGPEVPKLLEAMGRGRLKVLVSLTGTFGEGALGGELDVVDNGIDPATGMLKLQAVLPNPQKTLWPGQFVTVRLVLGEIPGAVVLAQDAVMIGAEGPYVYVVKDGKTAELRPVVLGESDDEVHEIKSGVRPGETVVVQGQLNLRNGAVVHVVTQRARTSSQP
jgi:membrane fusion protein, multidrug efflux system